MGFKPERINAIILDCTEEFRKGPAVSVEEAAPGVDVVHIYAMGPAAEASPELTMIDVHFVMVGVHQKVAEALKDELHDLLCEWPEDRIQGGPSYIETGAVLGSQDLALRLIALGEAIGFWQVIIPEKFGFGEAEATRMAGSGFATNTGFRPDA